MPAKKTLFGLLFQIAIAFHLSAQTNPYFESVFKSFKNDPTLQGSSIGLCIRDGMDDHIIYKYNDSASLVPASCMKLITTGAALVILGPDHTFKTLIYISGNIEKNGVLNGDIIIIGGGDPTIGSMRFFKNSTENNGLIKIIRESLRNEGIIKITGKIILCTNYFDQEYVCPTWAWNDIGNYFGTGIYSINYNENIYTLMLKPGARAGSDVAISGSTPDNLNIYWDNRLKTGLPHSGDQSNIFGAPEDSLRILSGTIPGAHAEFGIKGSLPDPQRLFARILAKELTQNGFFSAEKCWKLDNGLDSTHHKNKKLIGQYTSPKLEEIINYTNLFSINLFAEAILKETGKSITGTGSRKSGIHAIKKHLNSKGIDTITIFMEDGCGLSRYNAISANVLSKFLAIQTREPYFATYLQSLPVSGQSGSMKNMGKGTVMAGNIWCKTGHMERVRAYSGYVKANSGKWICFSLLVNNYAGNNSEIYVQIEKLLKALTTIDE